MGDILDYAGQSDTQIRMTRSEMCFEKTDGLQNDASRYFNNNPKCV